MLALKEERPVRRNGSAFRVVRRDRTQLVPDVPETPVMVFQTGDRVGIIWSDGRREFRSK